MNGAYSLVLADPKGATGPVAFNMSRGELKPSRGFCVFYLKYNDARAIDEFGHELVFATHEAADTKADELAGKMNTDRGCFSVGRDWL